MSRKMIAYFNISNTIVMNNDFETADKGARLANAIIDTILVALVISYSTLTLILLFPPIAEDAIFGDIWTVTVYFLYYFIFEYFVGKTPGKYLTKTRVVNLNGGRPSAKAVLIRTVLRIIPFDIISYLFGLTGLHDLMSKTLVIKRRVHSIETSESTMNLEFA